ncbi:uncharacterized protein G2W53_010003 [Senna tora]|uniref:Uncharacterized protein n=1 Tax=Senna tora TaxID=362788 RepID=A0A834WZE3_9FABA|nr:uncharacterized protein G2W53_010003 [Senna tora]
MAWEKHGSRLNIFRTTNHGRISETFMSYDAKDLLLDMAWEERGSCLKIFQMTNRGRISETFRNYEAKDLLRKQEIAVGSLKPSQIMWQNISCAGECNTSVRVVFTNRCGFDAPIGVVMAWEERGSCLNIFQTRNHGRI